MNKRKSLAALIVSISLGLGACQQSSTSVPVAAATAASGSVTAGVEAELGAQPVAPALALPALTPKEVTFLQENNLAPLWQNKIENRENYPAFSGFFGADHYRIAFIFTHVVRDARQPGLFHVQGKNRFKKVITPFEGTLTVSKVADLDTFLDLDSASQVTARAYTVQAKFELRENPRAKGAGVFRGTGYLDMYRTADGHLEQCILMSGIADTNPTKGSGLQFEGEWVSNSTGQRKSVLLSNDPFVIAPMVLKDFGIGDRSGEINPKYAKLGWTEVWENEEWWAEHGVTMARTTADSL